MLNHLVAKVEDLKMGPSDTVLFTAPTGFDISIWQMLAPCMAGARCICVPQSIARDPSKLWPEIIRTGATIVEVVPSMLRAMLLSRGRQSHGVAENCQVRMMISTGEALPLDVCQQWHEAFPGRSLVNAYGPTECSDDVTHEIIEDSSDLRDRSVPIGNPIRNVTLRIMSDGGEPVPRGEEGELWVFGISVGNGYVGDPEATARSFGVSENGERYYRTGDLAAIGPGGSLHYLGRKDRQVKLGGVRIELEEIEGTLRSAPGVIDAAAVVEDTPSGGRLVAFCQMTAGRREHDAVLSTLSFARSRLPAEMIPASLTMVDAFPTTPNGKRDDAALLSMKDRSESLSRRPPTDISWVSDVYRQVFGVDAQDLSVSFLNAGGTSLDAIRFVAVARSRGVDLDLEKLMEAGSLAALGALGQIMSTPVPATSGAQRFVVPAIARGLLVGSAQDRGSFSTHMFKLVGCTDEPEALAIVNALEERHPILRAQAKPDRTALLTEGGVTQGFATSFSAGCPDGELTATLGALPLDPEGRLVRWVYGRGERGSASAIGMLFHDTLLDSVSLDILADSIIRWAGADALPGADPNEVWRWLAAAPPVPPQITHCADEDDDRGEVSVHLDEYPACDPTAMESLALRTFVSACIPSDEDPFVDAGFEGRLEIGGSSISDAVGNFHLTTPIRTSRIRNARSAADVDRLLTTARKVLSDRFEATALSAPEECIVAPYAFDFVRHGQAGPRPCGSKRLIKGKPTSGYQLEGIVRVEYPHVTITLKFDSSKLEPGFAMLRIQDWATGFAAAASSDNAGAQ